MAAFQQYPSSFLVDSLFLPNNNVPSIKTPGVLDEFMPNFNNLYSTFETNNQEPLFVQNTQEGSSNVSAHDSSCLEQHNINKSCSLTEKHRTESLSMEDKAESGEQLTQNCVPLDKKRKSRKGTSSTSANSKDVKKFKSKKQKEDKEAKNNEKNDNKAIEEPPKGYIHVRARRGQATDSHSLAERVRREKISERMKMLQALVPGCDKVTGKALMLDEIINYVQSLQNQVEFLSMKLASLDPMVYTFGLMDHDPMLFGTQAVNNGMSLMQPTMNGGNSIDQAQAFANTKALSCSTTSSATTSTFPGSIDSSANFFQPEQKPSLLTLQDAGSVHWGVNEQQRRSIINQFGLFSATNLYSLQ